MTSARPVQQAMRTFPSMQELTDLAFKHDKQGLLNGLARRYDALGRVKYEQAVSSFNFLTENPKKAVQEAKWAGESTAGEEPETPAEFVNMLWEICNGND